MMRPEPRCFKMLRMKIASLLYGKAVYRKFAERLPLSGNEQVLDFGCGMGNIAFYTCKRLPEGKLTCLDFSERLSKVCRKNLKRFKNVAFLLAEVTDLPEKNFDVIYCHYVLHNFGESELEVIIPALVKTLKTGGYLIFREPLKKTDKLRIIKRLLEKHQLSLDRSRITDLPLLGNALESVYKN